MKKKGAKSTADLLDLSKESSPVAEASADSALPSVLEYQPYSSTERWRVQLFELFQAQFNLPLPYEKSMAVFQELAESQVRGWMIIKMVYGVTPVIIPADMDPKEMEAMPRETVCDRLGLDKSQLQAELEAIYSLFQVSVAANPAEESQPSAAAAKGELEFDEDKFKEFGFSESIFQVYRRDPVTNQDVARPQEEKTIERNWFIKRVCEWGKMLSEPMVSALVRQALMNELYLRRLETEISMVMPGTEAFGRLQRTKKDIEETYEGQLEKIKTNFPEMNVAGKVSLRGALSDLKDAYIEYKKDGSTRLVDRMRTVYEIEVELRQSIQKPEPQLRMGLQMYWIEAAHGLLDPNWRTEIPMRVLKKMDAASRAAIEAARQEMNEPLVDLERGVAPGEGSQYPDLIEEK